MNKSKTFSLEEGGRTFDFQLHQREVLFGKAGVGQYFWMDSRRIRHGVGGPNIRPCIDLWWHLVELNNVAREIGNEMMLFFAECYPLINTSKAMQEVYKDAHLPGGADREVDLFEVGGIRKRRTYRTDMLPEEEVECLRKIAHSRDTRLIHAELDGLFRGPAPPAREMPAFDEAEQAWIGNGIVALRQGGRDGLQCYLSTVDDWVCKLRKRGGIDDRVRIFLNRFSYKCKIAFYSCYSNAWVGIFQLLQKRGELDLLGERFMRMWHYQTPPAKCRQDIFSGQIPALHPLSAIVLTSPQHLEVIGRYIGRPDYDELQASGAFARTEEYWEMVTTFLVAAREYDRSRRRWEDQRKLSTWTNRESVAQKPRDDGTASAQILFENYSARRKLVCSKCSGTLSYGSHEPVETSDPAVVVAHFLCQACGHETRVEISEEDLNLTQRF